MARAGVSTDVYLEVGTKRTFACAVEWPGWSRSGRDDASALDTLVAYGPRYAAVLRGRGVLFRPPHDVAGLRVVERLRGDAATDFGVPAKAPATDQAPLTDSDLARCRAVLRACWAAFDEAVTAARGRRLRVGPRGGGRTLARIVDHVLEAEAIYIAALGGKASVEGKGEALSRVHGAALAALEAAARGELPRHGPRGGRRWFPRYFTRRAAWHVLDHTWEIQDRITPVA